MSDCAWIFPGQGSQRVGMGQDLAENYSCAREVFDTVDDALGFDLSTLIFEGPEEALVSTSNQQPAILATSIAYMRVLRERNLLPDPTCVAGHSLGEYTALVASGALELADAARIVRRRGELMEEHGLGGMIAIVGLQDDALDDIARQTGAEVANFNAPGQTTLSGRSDVLERAAEMAKAHGARRVVPLAVNGAFHSSLMRPVAEALRPMIEDTLFEVPVVPLVANVDARLLENPGDLRSELLEQITASVRWVDVVRRSVDHGVQVFYEVGPGRVLTGLVARIASDVETVNAESLLRN